MSRIATETYARNVGGGQLQLAPQKDVLKLELKN